VSLSNPSAGRRTRFVLWAVLAALLVALAVWLYSVFSKPLEPNKRRTVQEISLLKPPPPPPPPKTPPPPPPPPQQQPEKIDVPKPAAAPPDQPSQAPPPGPNLGVDAAGSGSGDGFGLVGKPGGGDLIGGGGGGGSGGKVDPFAWYGALVKERITDAISKDKKLKAAAEFQRNVNVWVNASGAITRVELVGQAQNPELDEALRLALRAATPVREGAPGEMPQPIRLRVSTRS
jgi:periplasmic protein TonB